MMTGEGTAYCDDCFKTSTEKYEKVKDFMQDGEEKVELCNKFDHFNEMGGLEMHLQLPC